MNINNTINGIGQQKLQPKKTFDSKNAGGDSFKSLLAAGTQVQSKQVETPVRTDRIQFSHSNIQTVNTLELSNLKNKIATDLNAETKTEKLERISKQIEQKEYTVDPYELADIMFRM